MKCYFELVAVGNPQILTTRILSRDMSQPKAIDTAVCLLETMQVVRPNHSTFAGSVWTSPYQIVLEIWAVKNPFSDKVKIWSNAVCTLQPIDIGG